MPIIVDPNTPSAAVSAGDIVTTAAKKLGVIGQSESLGAAEMADGLALLNSLIDALGIDRTMLHHVATVQYTWPSSTQTRTIGDGGNIDTDWPSKIESGTFFRDSGNNDFPVTVTHDAEQYERISYKPVGGSFPKLMFYDRAFPLGTLKIFPFPSESMTLFLKCWQPLQSFSTPTTGLTLPPGYRRLLEHNLAVEMEGPFGMTAPQSVKDIAKQSRADIARVNLKVGTASLAEAAAVSSGSSRGANILSGD